MAGCVSTGTVPRVHAPMGYSWGRSRSLLSGIPEDSRPPLHCGPRLRPRAVGGQRSSRSALTPVCTSLQDTPPSAGEGGDHGPQDAAVRSRLPLSPDPRVAAAGDSPLSRGKGVDVEPLETQPPPSQKPVHAGLCSDAREPPSLEPAGSPPGRDAASSVTTVHASPGARAGPTAPGTRGAELQGRGRTAARALTHSAPHARAAAQGTAPPQLPRRPSPGRGPAGSVPLRPAGTSHLEIPGSGSTDPHQAEGRHETHFPSGCEEMLAPCPPVGSDSEKCQGSGLVALMDSGAPCSPGQPTECPHAPSRAVKKRSLEGMRKQTRVEFSDTSSDDEDRLVIEI